MHRGLMAMICLCFLMLVWEITGFSQTGKSKYIVEFYGSQLSLGNAGLSVPSFNYMHSAEGVKAFYDSLNSTDYHSLVDPLIDYKNKHQLEDWLYYQLIRRTTEQISPKANNYFAYTLYKWFLMTKSGYDVVLRISKDEILFYIKSDDNIYNIPQRIQSGKQYVCLNYHDYENHRGNEDFIEISSNTKDDLKTFSYKITRLPDVEIYHYPGKNINEKNISFEHNQRTYYFNVRFNAETKNVFKNYPVVDYEYFCNIPLSRETHASLIPLLKQHLNKLSKKQGIDYLMRFTRYAFTFERDIVSFGQEKRLSPEQTLLYENSDCEDRVALFFSLVKEIYDLPMIVLVFPGHVTIAVKLDKPSGRSIVHNGVAYTICEPTPQKKDLELGQLLPELKKARYEIAYIYTPEKH